MSTRLMLVVATGLAALAFLAALPGGAFAISCPGNPDCPFSSARTVPVNAAVNDVAVGPNGNLYTTSFAPANQVTIFNSAGQRVGGFSAPVTIGWAIEVSADGQRIWVLDTGGNTGAARVLLLNSAGQTQRTYGAGQLGSALGFAVLADGDVVVADTSNSRLVRFDAATGRIVGQFGGSQSPVAVSAFGPSTAQVLNVVTNGAPPFAYQLTASFTDPSQSTALPTWSSPAGLGSDGLGDAYVSDLTTDAVLMLGPGGGLVTFWDAWNLTTPQFFNSPSGIAVQGNTLYVADNQAIEVFTLTPDGSASFAARTATMDGAGRMTVPVLCRGRGVPRCVTRVDLRLAGRGVGTASGTLAAGARRSLPLRLVTDLTRRMRAGERVRVTAELRTRRAGRRDRVHRIGLTLLGEDRR